MVCSHGRMRGSGVNVTLARLDLILLPGRDKSSQRQPWQLPGPALSLLSRRIDPLIHFRLLVSLSTRIFIVRRNARNHERYNHRGDSGTRNSG
jgi:hypothetical protein